MIKIWINIKNYSEKPGIFICSFITNYLKYGKVWKVETMSFSELRVSSRFWGWSQFSWFGGWDQIKSLCWSWQNCRKSYYFESQQPSPSKNKKKPVLYPVYNEARLVFRSGRFRSVSWMKVLFAICWCPNKIIIFIFFIPISNLKLVFKFYHKKKTMQRFCSFSP